MGQDKLVSIITPFFNDELFLKETIDSVLNQDYDLWELLLIDDGSSDKSTEIAQGYVSQFPEKIFYFIHEHHKNKGLCASRNLALSKAKGEFIALLDADDIWLPGMLSNQVKIFSQNPDVSMVCEASKLWHNWDPMAYKTDIVIPIGAQQDRVYKPKELNVLLYPLRQGHSPCPCSVLIKKVTLIKIGGFQNEFTGVNQLYEDQAFLTKIYLSEKVYVSSSCNNFYRQRRGSIVETVKSSGKYDAVRKFYLKWLQNYLIEKNVFDPEIERLIKKAWFPYLWPRINFIFVIIPKKAISFLKRMIKKYLFIFLSI
ncbi:MAG: hypothetical protein NVS1B13_15760 [Flavisolibacter sp.]